MLTFYETIKFLDSENQSFCETLFDFLQEYDIVKTFGMYGRVRVGLCRNRAGEQIDAYESDRGHVSNQYVPQRLCIYPTSVTPCGVRYLA